MAHGLNHYNHNSASLPSLTFELELAAPHPKSPPNIHPPPNTAGRGTSRPAVEVAVVAGTDAAQVTLVEEVVREGAYPELLAQVHPSSALVGSPAGRHLVQRPFELPLMARCSVARQMTFNSELELQASPP